MLQVPQGSIGPLLFLICNNDLHKPILNSGIYHFADDTNLLLMNKSSPKINNLSTKTCQNYVSGFRQTKYS